jgi:hypothetical protein
MEDYIKILLAIFVCFMIAAGAKYYFENNRKNNTNNTDNSVISSSDEQPEDKAENFTNSEKPNFIKSEWAGSKPGYVFYRSDENGLGYHLDVKNS